MTAAASLIAEPLWQRTRASFDRAIAAIGAPALIAALKALTPHLRRAIVGPLCRLEHVVRKLLLTEAAELRRLEHAAARRAPRLTHIPLAQSTPAPAVTVAAASPRTPAQIDLDNPETWRVTFSFCEPRDPRRVAEAQAPRLRLLWGSTPPPPPPPAPIRAPRTLNPEDAPFHLARRLEAVRRVLADPMPHARRLCRLLVRAVRRFPEIVRRYVFAVCRTNYYDPHDAKLGVDAIAASLDAPLQFPDSS